MRGTGDASGAGPALNGDGVAVGSAATAVSAPARATPCTALTVGRISVNAVGAVAAATDGAGVAVERATRSTWRWSAASGIEPF
jgi:hypothetical protein